MAGLGSVIGVILGWLGYQLGLRTDAADAAGSLHAKSKIVIDNVQYGTVTREVIASSDLRLSADTERGPTATLTCQKQIKITQPGVYRIAFDLRQHTDYSGQQAHGRVYIDGEPKGTQRTTTSISFTTYTEDIYVPAGSFIQLYTWVTSGFAYCRNFRIYFNYRTSTPVGGVVWQD